jgi:RNA-directed DNA polymerase
MRTELERIRRVARRNSEEKFTSLWHHVYDKEHLKEVFLGLKRNAAAGVDEVTWYDYRADLDERLEDLSSRLARGAYRPKPVKRIYIPKADGSKRPIGIPTVEDKLVQSLTAKVLSAIYEEDFLGFSYGFRPGRNPHDALDAVSVGIEKRKVDYVFDADIRGFFDAIDHEWMIRFLEHRIGDPRVIRHIKKWLHAGVMEEGSVEWQEEGTPQGGSISPLLANIYLHYAFDLWAHAWRKKRARGDVAIVRYADDFIVGFQSKAEAKQFQRDLVVRFRKFGLELHPEKTRLIEFGRYAAERRAERGEGKPETFNFLGFTHFCGEDDRGWFRVHRCTEKARLQRKLHKVKREIKARRHHPVGKVGAWLKSVLTGHCNYYSVYGNENALKAYRWGIIRTWRRQLSERSQRGKMPWHRMKRIIRRYLSYKYPVHPPPYERLIV